MGSRDVMRVWLTLLGLISAEGSGDDGPEDLFEDDGKDIDMAFPEGYDDNYDRRFTYCFKIRETFNSKHWVKSFPSQDSRMYHFHRMLKKRNAKNVQKSVSF